VHGVAELVGYVLVYHADYGWQAEGCGGVLGETIYEQPFGADGEQNGDGAEIGLDMGNVLQGQLIIAADVDNVVIIGKGVDYPLGGGLWEIARPGIFVGLILGTAIGLQEQDGLLGGTILVAVEILLAVVDKQLRHLAMVFYTEHFTPYLYEMGIALYKGGLHVWVVAHYFILLPLYVLLIKVAELIGVECLYMRIAKKHLRIAGDNNKLVIGVLGFKRFEYCSGCYAFAHAAVDLENNVHCDNLKI